MKPATLERNLAISEAGLAYLLGLSRQDKYLLGQISNKDLLGTDLPIEIANCYYLYPELK